MRNNIIEQKQAELASRLALDYFGLSTNTKFQTKKTKGNNMLAKQLAQWLLVTGAKYSLSAAGFYIYRNDHSSVHNSMKKIRGYRDVQPRFKQNTNVLRQEFIALLDKDVTQDIKKVLNEFKNNKSSIEDTMIKLKGIYLHESDDNS